MSETLGAVEAVEAAVEAAALPPVRVSKERYTSPDFAASRWSACGRVWQVACTVDHVSDPGDWFEHRCGPLSVLIVRGDDGELRAFQNVCQHRGTASARDRATG